MKRSMIYDTLTALAVALALILTVLPGGRDARADGYPYGYDEQVNTIILFEVTEPAVGRPATTDGITYGPSDKVIFATQYGILWRDETAGRDLGSGESFLPGHAYSITMHFTARTGYTFGTDPYHITVGGAVRYKGQTAYHDAAVIGYSTSHVAVKYTFPALPKPYNLVDTITITNVDAPAIGRTPDRQANYAGNVHHNTAYGIGGVKWTDDTAGREMGATDVFQGGHAYSISIAFSPNSGYTFSYGPYGMTVSGTVNGNRAETAAYGTTDVIVRYSFPALPKPYNPVETITITGVTEPEAGARPQFRATVAGEGVTLNKGNQTGWYGGVCWMAENSSNPMSATDVFGRNTGYTVRISVIPVEGYTFTDASGNLLTRNASINGHPARIVKQENWNLILEYTFPAISGKLFPEDFTGFMSYQGGLFFVSGGDVVADANGVVQDPNNGSIWYFCAGGQVQLQYTGLAEYGGQWFCLLNGMLDTNHNGLVGYDGQLFIVAAGRILSEYNGLIQDPDTGVFWYVAAGRVVREYTGLVNYDGAWFYVTDGSLATGFTGTVVYDGVAFNVVGGQVY